MTLEVRQLTTSCPAYRDALALALTGRSRQPGDEAALVEFVDRARAWDMPTDLVCAAYADAQPEPSERDADAPPNDPVAASAALPSPGGAALVWFGPEPGRTPDHSATILTLQALQARAGAAGMRLLEALLPEGSDAAAQVLAGAGFTFLTRLLYMSRRARDAAPAVAPADDLTWLSYADGDDALFCAALEQAYEGSLDCPGLQGIRATADILAGHRATGRHDPHLWWVVQRGDDLAGVLLLTELPAGALEIVYIGVSSRWRGTGVADALLSRAMTLAEARGASHVTLAVDRSNSPARRMYQRWGFAQRQLRDAWITTCAAERG